MTITDAVKESFRGSRSDRLLFLIDKLVEHLHDFTRETNLTQDEWMGALQFMYDCGQISSANRHEFILLSDVLGWSALVDMINTKGGGTELSNLGPFYLKDAPVMANGTHLAKDRDGVILLANGIVRDTLGNPLAGAVLDTWQADGSGTYPIQEKGQDPMDLRGRFTTESNAGLEEVRAERDLTLVHPFDDPLDRGQPRSGRRLWMIFRIWASGRSSAP